MKWKPILYNGPSQYQLCLYWPWLLECIYLKDVHGQALAHLRPHDRAHEEHEDLHPGYVGMIQQGFSGQFQSAVFTVSEGTENDWTCAGDELNVARHDLHLHAITRRPIIHVVGVHYARNILITSHLGARKAMEIHNAGVPPAIAAVNRKLIMASNVSCLSSKLRLINY